MKQHYYKSFKIFEFPAAIITSLCWKCQCYFSGEKNASQPTKKPQNENAEINFHILDNRFCHLQIT